MVLNDGELLCGTEDNLSMILRVLQRTSISTNIKERLDFSCAMFGPDGGLVANAPHIPVHLGAMQETVQYQVMCYNMTLHIQKPHYAGYFSEVVIRL